MERLEILLNETPPEETPQRYGNKAFKTWYAKVENEYDSLIKTLIGDKQELSNEIKNYFLDCFGSSKRLDYGTGHELNFICIIIILIQTGYIKNDDFAAVVHHIFFRYLLLVRNLQITYKLEPAGAHGVWGLDEYHFAPFIFGASELINNDLIKPSNSLDDKIIKEFSDTYMYISSIKYIKDVKLNLILKVKKGDFSIHSPVLFSITDVPNWEKVSKGLIKMFQDEVLNKFVVVQHFYFGSILPFE